MVRCNGSSGIKAITAKSEPLLFDEFVAAVCMVKTHIIEKTSKFEQFPLGILRYMISKSCHLQR